MKRTKVLFVVLVVLMVSMMVLSGCQTAAAPSAATGTSDKSNAEQADTGEKVKIGFANLADTDLFCKRTMDYFVNFCAESHPEWEVICADANLDVNTQISQVENFVVSECDAIVIMPVDYEGAVPAVEAANAANIPVICLVIDAAGGEKVYVGSDNYECGKIQAEVANEQLPENAKIVYLAGTPGLHHATLRMNGFTENLKRDDVEILSNMPADFETEKGMSVMEDWLQTYDQIDGLISANDTQAHGAIQAMKAVDRLDNTFIISVDGSYDAFTEIANGEMYGTMFYNGELQAKNAIGVIEKFLAGETEIEDVISKFELVTKDNVAEYMKKVYGEDIEVTAK